MFSKLNVTDDRKSLSITIDGDDVMCREGDTVAAVVMLHAARPYRHSILSGSERAPFCMMGICFECLVEIDGVPNQQGCLRGVESGMRIRRQVANASMSPVRKVQP
ncbi:(2Fe-2S)-binding protein [Rhizobium sp. AG855]|uniref:(2Fe-2S)-binding protein n=1 Tax=Rhizobium sp. AG855 TaxID=2183898 RepID=UPI000E770D97|nr:(2Fe-2S)-binding protein [Rhizobium sp. AG855]RKE84659.1 2Fe-2S iron-sulfur cluster protein [Rhizobium sp. AG855]